MVSFDLIVEPSDQVKKRCGRRCSECGCEVCYTHDEGDYFPEECCVSASGEPFEDCCDDVYGTIGEAIREWTSKPFLRLSLPDAENRINIYIVYQYINFLTFSALSTQCPRNFWCD